MNSILDFPISLFFFSLFFSLQTHITYFNQQLSIMAFHRIAFAEDVMSQDSSISPALLYDEMDFPPLQDGWQLLNEADADDDDDDHHHHAFVHKVVPQEWDWQCITKEHRPALYAQVASRALDDDDSTNTTAATFTLPVVAKPARRRSSLLRKATDTWHPTTFESQHDLGDELHGQYKSSHRRLRRSMKLSAKQRPRRQRYTTSVVFDHGHHHSSPVDEQGRKRRQRTTTTTKGSSSTSSNNKKIALEQGLDWVVSFP